MGIRQGIRLLQETWIIRLQAAGRWKRRWPMPHSSSTSSRLEHTFQGTVWRTAPCRPGLPQHLFRASRDFHRSGCTVTAAELHPNDRSDRRKKDKLRASPFWGQVIRVISFSNCRSAPLAFHWNASGARDRIDPLTAFRIRTNSNAAFAQYPPAHGVLEV